MTSTASPSPTVLDPPARTAWHGLDPLTRLVVSVGTVIATVLLGGIVCPLLLAVAAVLVPALIARGLREVLRLSLVLALPLAISVALVNVLFGIGDTALAEIGPLTVTEEGVALAAEVVIRVFTMAGAVVLFYVTTRPAELVASLQHHGVPAKLAFVIHNGVAMIPLLVERASEVTDAQRARGLDTEGDPWRRARGVVAVAAPTVLGAVAEVEARTLALETRAFTRPGRHTVLRVPHDSRAQRAARWGVAAALVLSALARISGVALPC
jgi:energy-coupling factor transport system permease protein